jgi:hypothetical protein
VNAARKAAALVGLAAIAGASAALPANAHVGSTPGVFSDGALSVSFMHRHLDSLAANAVGGLTGRQTSNVQVVSKLALKNVQPEKIADVGVSPDGNTAFLSAWGGAVCKYNGIHVVDIANPKAPREVAFIPSKEGSYAGEGVQSLNLTTSSFNGTIVVSNSEVCKDKAGFGGINIHDVTKPSSPTPLAVGIGDTTVNGQGKKAANQNHSVFAWDAGDKGYLVSVDNEEAKDVDIFDISNPKAPKLIAEYDLLETFPKIKQAAPSNLEEIFLHDMVVKEIGGRQIMLLSYWDGGYIKLDVTNPLAPAYIADSDFATLDPEALAAPGAFKVAPEGNAHQAEFTKDNKYIIAADEDFAPYALVARTTDGLRLSGGQGSGTPQLAAGQVIDGDTIYVGRACPGDAAVPQATSGDQIAVVERGVCTFTEKAAAVDGKGYEAMLVINREGSDACSTPLTMSIEGSTPAFGVTTREQGFKLFGLTTYDDAACEAGNGTKLLGLPLGTTGKRVEFGSFFDGWGYVHVLKNGTGKLTTTDTYAIREAHDPKFASGYGDLSVHEVATSSKRGNLAYLAYYASGFQVVEIDSAGKLVKKGEFIDKAQSNFWGVEVFSDGGTEYVAASDRDKGLYIFKYTGQ